MPQLVLELWTHAVHFAVGESAGDGASVTSVLKIDARTVSSLQELTYDFAALPA